MFVFVKEIPFFFTTRFFCCYDLKHTTKIVITDLGGRVWEETKFLLLFIIIIIFIYCNWVVTRWQWLFYM